MQECENGIIGGSKGAPGTRAPAWGSKFFHFHAVFGRKICKITPIWKLAPPPQENPGSATGYAEILRAFGIIYFYNTLWQLHFVQIRLYVTAVFCNQSIWQQKGFQLDFEQNGSSNIWSENNICFEEILGRYVVRRKGKGYLIWKTSKTQKRCRDQIRRKSLKDFIFKRCWRLCT